MKMSYTIALLVCGLLLNCSANGGNIPDANQEQQLLNRFNELWQQGDDVALPEVAYLLGKIGGTNTVSAFLPHLDYNPAIAKAQKSPYPNAPVSTVGFRFVLADAIKEIGLPMDRCLAELESSSPDTDRERLLVEIGVSNHGRDFITNIVERANTEQKRWLHAEHLCIPMATVATNATWPVSMEMSFDDTGISVSVSNYLASALSIPGTPLSRFRNTVLIFDDPSRPRKAMELGSAFDYSLSTHPESWYCSIPSHSSHSFSVSWDSITNACPANVWENSWQIQWVLRDDMNHRFLSNPIPIQH